MFAFGGESRFLVYPVTYKGKFDSNDSEEEGESKSRVVMKFFIIIFVTCDDLIDR